MKIRIAATGVCLLAIGCAAQPVIYDLENDKVQVQANGYTDLEQITQTAMQGCAIHSRTAQGPLSTRPLGNYGPYLHLYACKNPA
jgi:hypothetical protein